MPLNDLAKLAASACAVAVLAGCSTTFLPSSGPSSRDLVFEPGEETGVEVKLVDLTVPVLRRLVQAERRVSLTDALGGATAPNIRIGPGDAVEVLVWEAPPAALFGTAATEARGNLNTSSRVTFPEQIVNGSGNINIPFAGAVRAIGRTPQEVGDDIARRLKGKANDPQVIVRIGRSVSSTVTVVGEVNNSTRLPLTAQGERLLDALAATGGLRQPVGRLTVRITRETVDQGRRITRVASVPLEAIITDPAQNVVLQPGDVLTVLHQPNTLTVLGATSRNEELAFETQGITLAQAVARAGGLQDSRANPAGVFIFRFEDPAVLDNVPQSPYTLDGRVPVVYRADFKDPTMFFLARDFPMRHRDILFVSNAPAAELQKFMNLLSNVVLPVLTIRSVTD